jgi:hypothetical protein
VDTTGKLIFGFKAYREHDFSEWQYENGKFVEKEREKNEEDVEEPDIGDDWEAELKAIGLAYGAFGYGDTILYAIGFQLLDSECFLAASFDLQGVDFPELAQKLKDLLPEIQEITGLDFEGQEPGLHMSIEVF